MSDYAQSLIKGLKARYKCYMTLYNIPLDFTGVDFTNPTVLNQTLTAAATEKTLVGATQNLSIQNTRSLNVWRELKYDTAGRPVESYPGLPDYALTLERIVLYDSMLTDVFYPDQDDSLDISKQTTPLVLQVIMECPDEATAELYTKTWYIYGLWFLNSSISFDVESVNDLKIIQHANAKATGIIGDN